MDATAVITGLRKLGVLVLIQGNEMRVLPPPGKEGDVESLLDKYVKDAEDPLTVKIYNADITYLIPLAWNSRDLQKELSNGVEVDLTHEGVTLYGDPASTSLKSLATALGNTAKIEEVRLGEFAGLGSLVSAQLLPTTQTYLYNSVLQAVPALAQAPNTDSVKLILDEVIQPELEKEVEVIIVRHEGDRRSLPASSTAPITESNGKSKDS